MASRSIRWFGLLPALLLLTLGLLPVAAFSAERGPRVQAVAPAAVDEDASNARVIVKYRADSELARSAGGTTGRSQHARRLALRLALPMADGRPLGPHSQGLRATGLSSRQLVARLLAQPDVEWAVVDQRRTISAVLPNDPYYGDNQVSVTPAVGQWFLRRPDSTIVSAINAEAAWALTLGSPAITVAVLDTGVRFDHPDLLPAAQGGKLWPGYDFVRIANGNDGDGRDADASDPGDWSVAGDSCGAAESTWHGTQVAGLIGAATDNGIGVAGIGRNLMLLPVRVLGKCGGFDTDIQAAMLWAAGLSSDPVANPHPARVINLSLGSAGSCGSYQPIINQLTAAGVVVVVAAGNTSGEAVNSPANCSGVIAVAGLRHAGTKVGYSSLGPQVSLAAPAGNCVNETGACLYPLLTTVNEGTTTPGVNGYSSSSNPSLGTSFASPLVAGAVGLMLSADPTLTPAQVKTMLQATVRLFPTTGAQTVGAVACQPPSNSTQIECYCTTTTCGAGMLDAGAAVTQAVAGTLVPVVVIAASDNTPTAGASITLDGSGSSASAGRSISSYAWAITSGAGLASFTGAINGRSATLATSAAGSVVVSLTVSDNTGASRSSSQAISVAAVPVVVTPSTGSSGGGALGGGWLLALAGVVGVLRRLDRRHV